MPSVVIGENVALEAAVDGRGRRGGARFADRHTQGPHVLALRQHWLIRDLPASVHVDCHLQRAGEPAVCRSAGPLRRNPAAQWPARVLYPEPSRPLSPKPSSLVLAPLQVGQIMLAGSVITTFTNTPIAAYADSIQVCLCRPQNPARRNELTHRDVFRGWWCRRRKS